MKPTNPESIIQTQTRLKVRPSTEAVLGRVVDPFAEGSAGNKEDEEGETRLDFETKEINSGFTVL